MIAAVAIGAVVLGVKEDLARTAMLNEGHAVDVAELGADKETGADVLYEVKYKSALCKQYSAGKVSAALGGQPKSMGHKIGFGNTKEPLPANDGTKPLPTQTYECTRATNPGVLQVRRLPSRPKDRQAHV